MPHRPPAASAQARRGLAERFLEDRRGATAIEYGLIASLVALTCITGISLFGAGNGAAWDWMVAQLTSVIRGG